jgi:hypothetical protein
MTTSRVAKDEAMDPQWVTVEAGAAVTEPLDDCRLEPKTKSLLGLRDAASPVDSVHHALRAIASDPAEALDAGDGSPA